jgi:hypothetical protein
MYNQLLHHLHQHQSSLPSKTARPMTNFEPNFLISQSKMTLNPQIPPNQILGIQEKTFIWATGWFFDDG